MSLPTDDPLLTKRCNDLLGVELGRLENGEPIFQWAWSEDLFWPVFATGRKIQVVRKAEIQIVGGGMELVDLPEVVPEYRKERQVRRMDTWYMTKWLSPEHLIFGWFGSHRNEPENGLVPGEDALRRTWEERFPGADFPSRGWRIATDVFLPRDEFLPERVGDPRVPNLADTHYFIHLVKGQAERKFSDVELGQEAEQDRERARVDAEVGDEIRDLLPAFANASPGKRGGFLCLPWTKFDRGR